MRKPLIICIVLAAAGALSVSLAMAATPPRPVKVGDDWFYKDTVKKWTITVKRNRTIRFKFVGDNPHNVWGYRGSTVKFKSKIKSSGHYDKKLTTTGTFKIVCDIHGEDVQSMKIKVVNP